MDLLRALSSNEFEAWCAVATRLDHFANRLSQGYPFLRIKPRYTGTPKEVNKIKNWLRPGLPDISEKIPVEVEFELNMDIQVVDDQIEVITKSDVNIKGKVKLNTVVEKLTKSKVPVEISAKSNTEGKITTNVKIAKYAMEFDTSGKVKFSVQTVPGVWVDSEMNATTGMFGGGVSLKGKELAEKLKLKGHTKWASYLKTGKCRSKSASSEHVKRPSWRPRAWPPASSSGEASRSSYRRRPFGSTSTSMSNGVWSPWDGRAPCGTPGTTPRTRTSGPRA